MTIPSARHIDAAISIVDTDEFKALMAVDRVGKCVELVAAAMAEGEARETANLIGIISDIRQKSGIGAKPMLGELADAIAERIVKAEREGRKRAAEIARGSSGEFDFQSALAEGRDFDYGFHNGKNHAADSILAAIILSEAGEGE